MTARLCRSVEGAPCQPVVTLPIPQQQKSVSAEDTLPPELTQGPPRLLTYTLSVLNRAGNSAGYTDPVSAAAGAAPAAVAGFKAMPQRKGIVLSWQGSDTPAGIAGWIRVDRIRTSTPPQQFETPEAGHHPLTDAKPGPEPIEQLLRLSETGAGHPTSAIDATAHTGNSYRYIGPTHLRRHARRPHNRNGQPAQRLGRDCVS